MRKVLIVGGTGRVGQEVARCLLAVDPDSRIVLGGRNRSLGEAIAGQLGSQAAFRTLDLTDPASLLAAMDEVDVVVHAAGPFRGEPVVLRAAIECGVPYSDVCDDTAYAMACRELHGHVGIPAITGCGVLPGVSNVMAAELIDRSGGAERVEFFFFVAGTGGAGPAILAATFLIACEPVTTLHDGAVVRRRAFSSRRVVPFPAPIGRRPTYLFDLPIAASIHETFGAPNVETRFGVAPDFWNLATRFVTSPSMRHTLSTPERAESFVARTERLVRVIDRLVGRSIGMRVEVDGADGVQRVAEYVHSDTVAATAEGAAHFALELLDGDVGTGVWYPEEAVVKRQAFLDAATAACVHFTLE